MLSCKLWGSLSPGQENAFGEKQSFVFGNACNISLFLSKYNFSFYNPQIKLQLTLKHCIHLTIQKWTPLNQAKYPQLRVLSNPWLKLPTWTHRQWLNIVEEEAGFARGYLN